MNSVLWLEDEIAETSPTGSPPNVETDNPYRDAGEHLRDELERIDQLVRAQTVRWRLTLAATKPENLWGMALVSDSEVESYLASPFVSADELSPGVEQQMLPYWRAADTRSEIIRQRRECTSRDVVLRLDHLAQCFALTPLERDILLVCLLPETDGRYRRLYGYLQDDATRTLPSVELVLQILHPIVKESGDGRAAFDVSSTLVVRQLVVLDRGPGISEALSTRSVGLDPGVASYLLGRDGIDARLEAWLDPRTIDRSGPPLLERHQQARLEAVVDSWRGSEAEQGRTVLFHGHYGSGRLAAAGWVCDLANHPLLAIDVQRAQASGGSWSEVLTLIFREAELARAVVCWTGCEVLLDSREAACLWKTLVSACDRYPGLSLLCSATAWEPAGTGLGQHFVRLDFPMPTYAQRCRLWQTRLPAVESLAPGVSEQKLLASTLANSFQLNSGQISDAIAGAAGYALRRDPQRSTICVEDLYEACRRQSTHRLENFARRIEPPPDRSFEDLVLPAPNRRQIEELLNRIRYRGQVLNNLGFERRLSLGKGLIVLFTGSSGTGKSMAAELLAQEQGVDLYKVDMSSVVSKYVGETEKNLAGVFDQAEDANAVLFFDEADALFGQRGEVKDARDRWANMEVNYLLQRVEEYSGVVILTSNLRQNIDTAFMRRLQIIVEFPFPDAELRLAIWQKTFPEGLRHPGEDELRGLAERFRFSGGEIKNIVVDAAFRALAEAGASSPEITRQHLVLAIAREFQKTGKPITAKDFGAPDFEWVRREIY